MPLVGFKPTISEGERPQTHALDRAATGTSVSDIRALSELRAEKSFGCKKDLKSRKWKAIGRIDL
jgi:hypothetical protein